MLSEQKTGGGTNLKYLLCRLDFNEYYHIKAIRQEEEKKRAEMRARGTNAGDNLYGDDYDYDNEDDDQDDDDEDDDNDDDDDEGDDDEDDDDNYGREQANVQ